MYTFEIIFLFSASFCSFHLTCFVSKTNLNLYRALQNKTKQMKINFHTYIRTCYSLKFYVFGLALYVGRHCTVYNGIMISDKISHQLVASWWQRPIFALAVNFVCLAFVCACVRARAGQCVDVVN